MLLPYKGSKRGALYGLLRDILSVHTFKDLSGSQGSQGMSGGYMDSKP